MSLLDWGILGPAFIAGLLVTAVHVPLGMQVLDRGIVFIDLAIAQIAGVGVIVAYLLGFEPAGWAAQAFALTAAVTGALFFTWTDRRFPDVQEAIIGVCFVLAASGMLLLLAHHPHGGEHLRDLLVGQILWVNEGQLAVAGALYGALLIALYRWKITDGSRLGFYSMFAVAVTVSVQLVGVYLVFASLIIPALATRAMQAGRLFRAYIVSSGGYVLGIVLSAIADLPTGPTIVCALAAAALANLYLVHRSSMRSA